MRKLLFMILTLFLSTNIFAHVQLLYTPTLTLEKGKTIELRQIFTHPFEDKYTLDMGKQHDSKVFSKVSEFYVINKKKKKNLLSSLIDIQFKGNVNSGHAYKARYKARKMGDHILILKTAPFYEDNQDIYIQQIVKTIINVAGAPTDWDRDLNLEAEIVPLTKPYSIWEGGSFTGIVKSNGRIVPYANIDVSYLNRDINIKENKMGKDKIIAPHTSFTSLGIKTNKNGEFTFTIPKAGFWGFNARDLNKNKKFKNKKLEIDGIIWVEAKPIILVKE
ncbi:MAG: DUF4198 domain-containing protein [Campylobacteraceae bacterium]|nr:DUF4198 domain-containing protein [Campylobacteraceae bacterium]